MKKVTLLFTFCFTLNMLQAQLVSTVFGSTANEADTEWTNDTFRQWLPYDQADNGKIQTPFENTGTIGKVSYTGSYSGTLSSTDVIFVKIRRAQENTPPIDKMHVSYSQNGGSIETQTFTLPAFSATPTELLLTPGFTDGATLGDLSFTMTQNDGTSPAFDNYRIYEFSIGPDVLSVKSNHIEGAYVIGKNGEITVKGAQLEAVYSMTGQKVESTNLPSGTYIVRISKENKFATIKVAL